MTQLVNGKFNVNNHAHIVKGTDKCYTTWFYFSFQHRNIIPYITRQGATRYKLNKASLLGIPFLLPPTDEQNELNEEFMKIEETIGQIIDHIDVCSKTVKSLLNQFF